VEEARAGSIGEEKGKSEFTNERKRVSFRRGGTSPFLSISEEVVFYLIVEKIQEKKSGIIT